MSKKNKSNKHFVNENLEIHNMDDIGYMTDEFIHDRATRLENEKNRLIAMGKESKLWEVEIAYLQREQQLRQARGEAHAEYVKRFVTAGQIDAIVAETEAEDEEVDGLN